MEQRERRDSFGPIWARVNDKVLRAATGRAREREAAGPLLAELMALPEGRRLEAVEAEPRFWTLGLADRLLAMAGEPRAGSARELAELALAVVVRLPRERYGESMLLEPEVVARCLSSDALRRRGELGEAESGFRDLARRLASEPLDLPERAVYCRFLARLYRNQERHDEALALLERAAALYREGEMPLAAGECLSEKGWCCVDAADLVTALAAFAAAVILLAEEGRPREALDAWLGLALCSAELGQPADAEHALASAEALYAEVPEPVDRLQLAAIAAWVADGLGRTEEAVARFEGVVAGLLAEGAFSAAAVAALDLVQLHAARGRAAGVERLRATLAPLLEPGALPEASRAVLLFALNFGGRRDRDATELLARCGRFLEKVGDNPRLRFETEAEPRMELWWDEVDDGFRRLLCEEAGVPAAVAGQAAAEVAPMDRSLISWTYEELARVRIAFVQPEKPLS